MKSKKIGIFLIKCAIYIIVIMLFIVSANYFIDASSVIKPQHLAGMAKLSLEGNIVAVPENYNERAYQVSVVEQMTEIPETIVIGSSRGMYLGTEITGYNNLYNNCVSGACVEDYYALLGLYYYKFSALPERIIIETGPWCFYDSNPEARWQESGIYNDMATEFYEVVNHEVLANDAETENPYLSISYFQYNMKKLLQNGFSILYEKENVKISTDENEAAEYTDGTIRYGAELENESAERLADVQQTKGACTYKKVQFMAELGIEKTKEYENLIDYLIQNGCEVIIFMQPFSVTQCKYSLDQGLNPGFSLSEEYLKELSVEKDIKLIGSYDARKYGLTDERFIDNMHLDRIGFNIVWNYGN